MTGTLKTMDRRTLPAVLVSRDYWVAPSEACFQLLPVQNRVSPCQASPARQCCTARLFYIVLGGADRAKGMASFADICERGVARHEDRRRSRRRGALTHDHATPSYAPPYAGIKTGTSP